MSIKLELVPVIESRPFQRAIVHPETCNSDNMQFGKCGGTKTGDVACVGRDLRLKQGDVKHQAAFSSSVAIKFEANCFHTAF